jgi:Fe-S-cluster containining protein
MASEGTSMWQLPGGLGRFGVAWPLVALLRALWWSVQGLDSLVEGVLKRTAGSRYERTGHCLKTGECCELISMEAPAFAYRWPRILGLFLRLGEIVYPFRLHARAGDEFLYTCENFDRQRRVCKNYRFRPKICRDYPAFGYFSKPSFFKGCGFGVRLRNRPGSFVEVLDSKRKEAAAPPLDPSSALRPLDPH